MARRDSDEAYVIDLCDEALGQEASRQHRFAFLVGDPGKHGRCVRLPVDAYYASLNLVIEFMERQHSAEVPFFDKPNRLTVSGVHRGRQRALYDERRRLMLPMHGITLVTICSTELRGRGRKLARDRDHDLRKVQEKLSAFIGRAS